MASAESSAATPGSLEEAVTKYVQKHASAMAQILFAMVPFLAMFCLLLMVGRPGCTCQATRCPPCEAAECPAAASLSAARPTKHHTLYPCTPWSMDEHHPDDEMALDNFFVRGVGQMVDHDEDVLTAQEYGLCFCAAIMKVEAQNAGLEILIMLNPRRMTLAKTRFVVQYYPVEKHDGVFLWVHRHTANTTAPTSLQSMKVQTFTSVADRKRFNLLFHALYYSET